MKIETIIEPNEHIFQVQKKYVDTLKRLFPHLIVELIGGMAVPMVGRPELDIMVISKDLEDVSKVIEEKLGLKQGPIEPRQASYLKKIEDGIDVTVQVLFPDNPTIQRHRKILAILRCNNELRRRYEEYKKTLAGLERQEYRIKKRVWLAEHIDPLLKE